nr:3-oxo-tetronate 4-phosphate decarboxylase-like [Nerophis lumbriciformis]
MSEASKLREQISDIARSLFDRGLTSGASGNISVRLKNGSLLVTPTGSSFRDLDPARISEIDAGGKLVSGDAPTKEMALHQAFYDTRSTTGAVVHLHSTHCVALSVLPDIDPDNVLPAITAYSVMRLGKSNYYPIICLAMPQWAKQ